MTSEMDETDRALMMCGSHQRGPMLVEVLSAETDPSTFWRRWQNWFSVCDNIWEGRMAFAWMAFRQRAAMVGCLEPKNREFFDALPDDIDIYRGCSRKRARGLSWTTDRSIAETFARGHRGIAVPDPVIASCSVKKADVLAFDNDREESEIIFHPLALPRLRYAKFGEV